VVPHYHFSKPSFVKFFSLHEDDKKAVWLVTLDSRSSAKETPPERVFTAEAEERNLSSCNSYEIRFV